MQKKVERKKKTFDPPSTFELDLFLPLTPRFEIRNEIQNQLAHRDFLEASVAELKRRNPGFLLLVREGEGIQAAAHARYDGGKELKEKLDGLDAGGVEGVLAKLVERGETMPRTAESAGALPGEK